MSAITPETSSKGTSNGANEVSQTSRPVQKRLNINMNEETAAALRELAQRKQISITEAVRQAIGVYKFFEDEIGEGRKIQTMDHHGGRKRDVVMM